MVVSSDWAQTLMVLAAVAVGFLAAGLPKMIKQIIEKNKKKQEGKEDVRHDSSE